MSRSYTPDEFLDPRQSRGEQARPRTNGAPRPPRSQGPGSGENEGPVARDNVWNVRGARSAELRKQYQVRGKSYRLRTSELRTLGELGKFRAVSINDLEEFGYGGDTERTNADVRNLVRRGLVAEKSIPHPETRPRRLLTLTKQGYILLKDTKSLAPNQVVHYGFTKLREAHHDADLYRLYYTAAEKIERPGNRNLRVVLDYELKKRVYHEIAKLGQDRNSSKWKKEIAERHGLQFVKGKIPLPDLRIEYETREGEMARVDLELATEHYRGRHLAEKVKAGFSIYAHAQDAVGLRRVLDQRELTAEILSL